MCRACVNEYMREYWRVSRGRQYARGAEAMRLAIVRVFEQIGATGEMNGIVAASIVKGAKLQDFEVIQEPSEHHPGT